MYSALEVLHSSSFSRSYTELSTPCPLDRALPVWESSVAGELSLCAVDFISLAIQLCNLRHPI